MEKNKRSTITEDTSVSDGLVKDVRIHTNLTQDVVVTTEDKIRICLMNYLIKIGKKGEWIAPLGILLTIIITLLTTNFKKFYFSADTWTAIFIISGGLSLIWLIACVKDAFISVEIDDVIDELKKGSPVQRNEGHIVYVANGKNVDDIEDSSLDIKNLQKNENEDKFQIIKGSYGVIDKNVDVTDKLKEMVKDEKLIAEATNSLVDRDPAPGTPKFLNIEYKHHGERFIEKFRENDAINLP